LRPTKEILLFLLFAFIAMIFVIIIILSVPHPTTAISIDDKLAVSVLFITSCCIGISLAIYPGWIHRIKGKKITTTQRMNEQPIRSFSGHHPDCERFQTHRITIGNKTWCAGCFGLLLGALVSIPFMVTYTISSTVLSRFTYDVLLLFGLVLVVVIFLETVSKNRHPATRLFFNAILTPGFFFITMSVTELTGKALYGVFTVLLCFLWLDARVILSTWRHRSTCNACEEPCKMYTRSTTGVS
jgi:hypothetical protein